MEIRLVEWTDSSGNGGWEPLDGIREARPMHIFSVGFVVDESDDHLTLLQSYDDRPKSPAGDNYISIPKIAVKSSRVVV